MLLTIAAIATPPGRGGVGIIRISGAKTSEIAKSILGFLPKPRYAQKANFLDLNKNILDQGLALYFPGPNSFTGEDVLELHGHGGPILQDQILKTILSYGAILAKPGEFSERAFLNNKLDLAQAEAIADLIDASSEQAARAAMRSLKGEFSELINNLIEDLIKLRIYVEAAIDFPEEEIDFLSDGKIAEKLNQIILQLKDILKTAQQGSLLREGMTVVIAGQPNAGKSSLLNSLSGKDRAIVTDIPGTTRDILQEAIQIDGLPLHIIDTAGLRESADIIEQEGIRRAQEEIKKADRILYVVDASSDSENQNHNKLLENYANKTTYIFNKIDLLNSSPKIKENTIYLSARTKQGIELLREHLKTCMGFNSSEGNFSARRRHIDALERAENLLSKGQLNLHEHRAGELLAEDLRQAQEILGEITGTISSDELLGKIFSSFCIGK